MGRKLVSTGLALLIWTALGQAQILSFGPQVGFQKTTDAENGGVWVGATARLKLAGTLKAEGAISYRQDKQGDAALTVLGSIQATAGRRNHAQVRLAFRWWRGNPRRSKDPAHG